MIQAHIVTALGLLKPIQQSGETLVIDRDNLQVSETETATHSQHAWILGNQRFLILKISSRVTVRLETGAAQTEELGPYDALWLLDGWVLCDLDNHEGLAHYDYKTHRWVLMQDESEWDRMVFTSAKAS